MSFFQGGRAQYDRIDSGIDTLFDFPLYYAIRRAFARDGDIRDLPHTLSSDHLYADPDRLVSFLGLHDVKRFMAEPGADLAGLRLAFTFLLTTRGIPLIYYGDEIAMPGGDDPDNRRDRGCHRESDRTSAYGRRNRNNKITPWIQYTKPGWDGTPPDC